MPVTFSIAPSTGPQNKGVFWYATPSDGGKSFLIGRTVNYSDGDGAHAGLAPPSNYALLPQLIYDREAAAASFGLWAHYLWPTVIAESGGYHLLVNTYDRARFTFGFYQLAAHTPNDNLILLFRRLLALPSAKDHFPDLSLSNGKVAGLVNGQSQSFEQVTTVHRPNGKIEDQLVTFMTYLNPDTTTAGTVEAQKAAALMYWLMSEQAAVDASIDTAVTIMRGKLKSAMARFGLKGRSPAIAIWVSDIIHQGRGSSADIAAALAAPDENAQLEALYRIGSLHSDYDGRRDTVRKCIATLVQSGVFGKVKLGDLQLDP